MAIVLQEREEQCTNYPSFYLALTDPSTGRQWTTFQVYSSWHCSTIPGGATVVCAPFVTGCSNAISPSATRPTARRRCGSREKPGVCSISTSLPVRLTSSASTRRWSSTKVRTTTITTTIEQHHFTHTSPFLPSCSLPFSTKDFKQEKNISGNLILNGSTFNYSQLKKGNKITDRKWARNDPVCN